MGYLLLQCIFLLGYDIILSCLAVISLEASLGFREPDNFVQVDTAAMQIYCEQSRFRDILFTVLLFLPHTHRFLFRWLTFCVGPREIFKFNEILFTVMHVPFI